MQVFHSLDVILGNKSDGFKCHNRIIHQGDPVETSTMASNHHFYSKSKHYVISYV